MFSRMIVATDLPRASFGVLNCLDGLRTYGAKQILLLLCLNFQQAASVALSYTTKTVEGLLGEQKEVLSQQGFEVETRVVPAFAKWAINRIAAEEDYSIIVVGSHGQSMVGEAPFGGVASEVIHSARKPVLVAPLEMKQGEQEVYVQATRRDFSEYVLFPTDFSENADHAFSYVKKLAAGGARRIALLHIQDKARIDSHLSHRLAEFDRARLEEMKARLRENSTPEIEVEVRYGSPFAEITRWIRGKNVNLVVMGSQGHGFVKEVSLGSVSHNVARHSPTPVLLIPAQRET